MPSSVTQSNLTDAEAAERAKRLEDETQVSSEVKLGTMTAAIDAAAVSAATNKLAGKRCILHPHGNLLGRWDSVTGLALIFTAIATPYEVAFLPAPTSASDGLFLVNRLVDIVFIMDICLSFFVMYRKQAAGAFDMQDAVQMWEARYPQIAKRYLRGWFFIDVFSVAPSSFDIIALASVAGSGDSALDGGCESAGGVSPVKLLRLIRILRLFKLIRLLKASRILNRAERRNTMPYMYLSFCVIVGQILILTHWLSSALALPAALIAESKLDTWLATFGLCWPDLSQDQYPDGLDACGNRLQQCEEPIVIYAYTFYWALGLVTGYANSPPRGPAPAHFSDTGRYPFGTSVATFRPGEITLLVIAGMLACAFWAYVTARLVDIIMNADPDTTLFRRTMDDLNRFCAFHHLPLRNARELREYFHEKRELMRAESRHAVTNGLSPMLAAKIAWEMHKLWMVRVDFFAAAEKPFLSAIALSMKHTIYVPTERPSVGRLYVIFQGFCRYDGKTLGKGTNFGERDVLLRNDYTKRPSATAVTYLHVHYIERAG